MAAQRPSRKPATSEDIKVCLKEQQLLQNGSSKMARYCGPALNLGFFLWYCKYNRWVFIISITFAFFSPHTQKELIILEGELKSIIPSYFIGLTYNLYAESFLWSLLLPTSPRRWTNVQMRKRAEQFLRSTKLKMTLGLERTRKPWHHGRNEEIQMQLWAHWCNFLQQNRLIYLYGHFCEAPIVSLCSITPSMQNHLV